MAPKTRAQSKTSGHPDIPESPIRTEPITTHKKGKSRKLGGHSQQTPPQHPSFIDTIDEVNGHAVHDNDNSQAVIVTDNELKRAKSAKLTRQESAKAPAAEANVSEHKTSDDPLADTRIPSHEDQLPDNTPSSPHSDSNMTVRSEIIVPIRAETDAETAAEPESAWPPPLRFPMEEEMTALALDEADAIPVPDSTIGCLTEWQAEFQAKRQERIRLNQIIIDEGTAQLAVLDAEAARLAEERKKEKEKEKAKASPSPSTNINLLTTPKQAGYRNEYSPEDLNEPLSRRDIHYVGPGKKAFYQFPYHYLDNLSHRLKGPYEARLLELTAFESKTTDPEKLIEMQNLRRFFIEKLAMDKHSWSKHIERFYVDDLDIHMACVEAYKLEMQTCVAELERLVLPRVEKLIAEVFAEVAAKKKAKHDPLVKRYGDVGLDRVEEDLEGHKSEEILNTVIRRAIRNYMAKSENDEYEPATELHSDVDRDEVNKYMSDSASSSEYTSATDDEYCAPKKEKVPAEPEFDLFGFVGDDYGDSKEGESGDDSEEGSESGDGISSGSWGADFGRDVSYHSSEEESVEEDEGESGEDGSSEGSGEEGSDADDEGSEEGDGSEASTGDF